MELEGVLAPRYQVLRPTVTPMSPPLAEREAALVRVRAVLESAVSGRGKALFVLGEAGLGKTTLLEQAVELAGGRLAVGVGRADVAEAALPFGLLGQALEPLLGSEVLSPRSEHTASYQPAADRLYAILYRLREVAVKPLLIALDDAHWADPDSLTLLRLICRRLAGLPVGVVVTARPWPPALARAADELAEEGLVDLERLRPLTTGAAVALLDRRVGDRARPEEIEAAVAACGGNPLLLGHVAAELEAGRALPEHGKQASGSWASRLLLSRFAGVGPTAEAYLRAASVLGSRFRPEVAADVAGLAPTEAARALEALVGARLVVQAGDGWATFSHHLVRLAVYDQVAPQHAHLHEAAFRVLLARRAPAAQVAEHAMAARLVGKEAGEILAQAGREALRQGAPGTAIRHLQALVELRGDATPPELLLDLAQAQRAVGDNEKAATVCEELLRRWELPVRLQLAALMELAQAEFRAGYFEQATARMEQAVRMIGSDASELAATALLHQAHLTVLRLGPRTALPLADRARVVGGQVGGQTRVLADAVWSECAYLTGDPSGLEAGERAAREAKLVRAPTPEAIEWSDPRVLYAELATSAERFAEAEQILAETVSEAEQKRHPMNLFEGQYLLVEVLRRTGRLTEAAAVADQLMAAAELMPFALPLAVAEKTLALLDLGRLDEAADWWHRLDEMTAGKTRLGRVWTLAHLAQALLAWRQGAADEASRVFGLLERSARRVDLLEPCIYPWAYPAVAAHLACGREKDAARVLDWLEPRAAVLPACWPRAVVVGARAALAEQAGDLAAASAGFAEATTLHNPAMPLCRAESLTDHGAFLIRRNRPAQARPVLAEAIQLADDCGATWHAERARVAWRRAGGRARATPAGELTPQEKAVADLARAGRTNKEIAAQLYLSVNTVETHLSHIYRKLGVTRRWQLIAGEETKVT
jgi:DNA-binding CsgD family transcriptional regulator